MTRFTALSILMVSVLALRLAYDFILRPDAEPAPLAIPFSEYPLDVLGDDGWKGADVELSAEIAEKAGLTDYINRRYTKNGKNVWLYVGYVSGWAPESIHHPKICFPSAGRELAAEDRITISIPGREEAPSFNEYRWKNRFDGTVDTYTVTSFYFNGRFVNDEIRLRAARITGIRYFAIITVSGDLNGDLEATREFYREIVGRALPPLLEHFPE